MSSEYLSRERQRRLGRAYDGVLSVAEIMKSHTLREEQIVKHIDAAIKAASLVPEAGVSSRLLSYCEQLANDVYSIEIFKRCATQKLDILADADVSLLGQIFDRTSELAGAACRAFIHSHDRVTFENRFCESRGLMRTHLIAQLEAHVHDELKAPLPIVGGPSGGGKTMAVLSLTSKERQTAVAYLVLPRLSILGSSPRKPSEFGRIMYSEACRGGRHTRKDDYDSRETKDLRNAFVADAVADALCSAIPSDVFPLMAELGKSTPSERLRLVVFLDEMGGVERADAVRALCCINASTVGKKRAAVNSAPCCLRARLEAKLGYRLPGVDIRLVVGGTGIGAGDDEPGSLPETYTMLYAYDGAAANAEEHMKGNRRIFGSFFSLDSPDDIDKLRPCVSPFFWRMISENARMAAILGRQVCSSIGVLGGAYAIQVLSSIDLTQFLAPAMFEFKSKNGLDSLRYEHVEEVLHKVVRMHWFPHALTIDADRMRTKYGLIVDRVRCSAEAGYSPNKVPYFTTALLSMLSGSPLVSQSLVSGAPLETYGSVLLYLLACAANDEDLFLAALDAHGGALSPYTMAFERNKDDGDALAMHTQRPFQPLIHDMAWDVSTGLGDEERVLSYAQSRLKGFKRLDKCLYIAMFKTYDKAPFADAFLMIGARLFLFQMKDYENGYRLEGFREELWKMGAFADAKVANLLRRVEESIGATPSAASPTAQGLENVTRSIEALENSAAKRAAKKNAKSAFFARSGSVAELLKKVVPSVAAATRGGEKLRPRDNNTERAPSDAKTQQAFKRLKAKAVSATSVAQKADLLGPRRLLAGLVQAWYGATGVRITTVHRVFVTPRPLDPDVAAKVAAGNIADKDTFHVAPGRREGGRSNKDSWTVAVDGRVRFVSVESVRFMPFEADRRVRKMPPLYDAGTERVFQIVEAVEGKSAGKRADIPPNMC